MASLEILLKAKNETDAAFNAVTKNLKEGQKGSEAFGKSLESTTSKAGKFAGAISATSTTLARSADAFGLPTAALRTLDDVADVAALGIGNLSTTVGGFDAATAGAAGAGLALGAAIGKLLLMIPGVTEAMDSLAAATLKVFTGAGDVAGEAAAKTANWSVEAKKAAAIQKEILDRVTKGMSAKEIQALLFPEPPKSYGKQLIERAKLEEEATKKRMAAAEAAAKVEEANAKRAAHVWQQASEKARADWDKFYDNMRSRSGAMLDDQEKLIDKWAKNHADKVIAQATAYNQMSDAMIEDAERTSEAFKDAAQEAKEAQLDAIFDVASAMQDLGGVMGGAVGTMIEQVGNLVGAFGNVKVGIEQIKNSGGGLTGVLGKIGGFASIAGTVLSVGKGLFDSLFGGAKKAREEMEKLKNEFISSQGGIASLSQKAKEAGVSLDALFRAKNADQLKAAIAGIKTGLDDWAKAQEFLKDTHNELLETAKKYGIELSQLGPTFAAQELDKMAASLFKEFTVLQKAGVDMNLILAQMGPNMAEYVQQAIKAGITIPTEMKPIVDALLAEGKILDENGDAYEDAEAAGIKYGESQSGMFEQQLDFLRRITEAIEKLAGIKVPPIRVPVEPEFSADFPGGHPHEPPSHAPGGGLPEFATGGPTGSGGGPFPAMLHPNEFVLSSDNLKRLEAVLGHAAALATSGSGGGGSAAPQSLSISIGGRELDAHINNRMRQRGIRSPQQQRGGRSF